MGHHHEIRLTLGWFGPLLIPVAMALFGALAEDGRDALAGRTGTILCHEIVSRHVVIETPRNLLPKLFVSRDTGYGSIFVVAEPGLRGFIGFLVFFLY